MAGIPPLGGFFAKFYVFISVIESELYTLAVVGLVTTVISAFYYLKVIKIIYFDEEQTKLDQIKNLQTSSIIFISCLLLISYFIYPSVLNNIIEPIFMN